MRPRAFTLLEAMLAVAIFALLMICVASIWMVSWRAAERVMGDQGDASRADFVLKRLGESVEAAVWHKEPKGLYTWGIQDDHSGENEGDRISFVTSLAPDAAALSSNGAPLERIQLEVRNAEGGKRQLVLLASPFTMEENDWQREVVLLGNVQSFRVQFWNDDRSEWVDGWSDEDHAPSAVRMAISVPGEKVGFDWAGMMHTRTARVDAMFAKEDQPSTNAAPAQLQSPPVQLNPPTGGAQPPSIPRP